MRRWAGVIVAAMAAVGLAIIATTPPPPVAADAPAEAFSADRAMAEVRRIAAAPHPTGSTENARVRAYLARRLQALGLEVREVEAPLPEAAAARMRQWSRGALAPAKLVNVIAVLPGRDRSLPAVALMAHHDTVWGSPGAADDTAGVATILEVLRAIRAEGQPLRDVAVVITDAEEIGLSGAAEFFARDPLRQRIGAVVNMEARGGGGRTTMFQTSAGNGEAMRLFADAVPRPGATSLAVFIYSVLPNDTDLSETLKGPWLGYNFAFIGRPGLYHSPKATPDRLDQGALQDMGGQVLALSHALANARELPSRSADAVFFDVFGRFLLVYPVWVGWVMLAALAIGLGALLRRESQPRAVAAGAARMAGLLAAGAVLLWLLNIASGAGANANYYDRLAAIPLLEAMALVASLGIFVLVFGAAGGGTAHRAGALLLLWLGGAAAQAVAPTAAYVLLVPLLLATIGSLGAGATRAGGALAVAGAALVGGYMLYLGHFAMQGVGPTMPFAAALPLALAAVAFLPLWPGMPLRRARIAGLALLGLALAVALFVRFDPLADTVAVYSLDPAVEPIPITKPA